MYEELMSNIDTQEIPTKDQVVNFLQDAKDTIESISDDQISSNEEAKQAFTNAFKEIANSTLISYQGTNNVFEELTKAHQETVDECTEIYINLPEIKEKFNLIQEQMSAEVERANNIITDLTSQVKELERNSSLDSLTKVFNKRALSTYLHQICTAKTNSYELHLLMLDIDDFKIINDTYGHIAGDKVLIYIANILRKTLRDGDKIFRFGGEEFVIILNRIDAKACQQITKRILNLISSNQLIYKGNSLSVTMSIGTTVHYSSDTPDEIIARADKALYKSKKSGKNQMNSELITDGN